MCFHVCPQTFCLSEYRVTLMAFVSYFSAVCFQMSPQISGLKRGIVTLHCSALVAFVQLVSPMCFQMSSQRAWIRAAKLTLAAFV